MLKSQNSFNIWSD